MKKSHLILQALADAPAGLPTSQVAAAIGEADAISNVSALLTYGLNCGRVEKVSGGAGAGEATWQITPLGERYWQEILAEQGDAPPPRRAPARPTPELSLAPRPGHSNGRRYGGALPPIESGIPVPEVRKPANKYRAAALAMKRGDRIVFSSKAQAHALAVQLRREGHTAALRNLDDGRFGVWRVK